MVFHACLISIVALGVLEEGTAAHRGLTLTTVPATKDLNTQVEQAAEGTIFTLAPRTTYTWSHPVRLGDKTANQDDDGTIEPSTARTITLQGQGAGSSILDGGANTGSTGGLPTHFFNVPPGGNLTLYDLTLANGDGRNMGAINVNGGTLTAVRVAFLKNKSPHGLAGAIFLNGGSATLDTCSFTGNSNTGGGAGAIQLDCTAAKRAAGCVDRGGTMSLTRCSFVGNTNAGRGAGAGAIQVDGGTMVLDGCSFEGNTEDDLDQGAGAIQVCGNTSVLNGTRSCSFFGGNSYVGPRLTGVDIQ